ncbi:MAG: hypothetical protein ACODAU_02170 [Myxococcota bacterium]
MTRWTSILVGMMLSGVLALGALGCGDDDDTPMEDAGIEDAGDGNEDAGDGDGGAVDCEEEVMEAQPGTPEECATCLCDNCESEAETCRETDGCMEDVECAQGVVGDGTCSPDDNSCVLEECEPNPEALSFLLCIQGSCLDECAGGDEADGGTAG